MQAISSLFSGCLMFKRPSFSGFVMTHSLKASFNLSKTAKDLKLSATASGLFTGYIVYFYLSRNFISHPRGSSFIWPVEECDTQNVTKMQRSTTMALASPSSRSTQLSLHSTKLKCITFLLLEYFVFLPQQGGQYFFMIINGNVIFNPTRFFQWGVSI